MQRSVLIPTTAQIVDLHDLIIARVGGSPGLRSTDMLASAWGASEMAMHYGESDVVKIACRLGHGIIKNHPFVDGNKRAAWGAMSMTFSMNGYRMSAVSADIAESIIAAAGAGGVSIQDGQDMMVDLLKDHVSPDLVHQALFDYDLGRS